MDTTSNRQIISVGPFVNRRLESFIIIAAGSLRLESFIIGRRKSKRPTNRRSESVEMVNKSYFALKRVTRKFQIPNCCSTKN